MTSLLAGVIGWPISHSLSPWMHRFWLHENGIAGTYIALPVRRHDLSRALESLERAGFAGVNLTLPHKEAAFALAQTADGSSRASQAANLLLFRDRMFAAHNTDVDGLVHSLLDGLGDRATRIERAAVLGAGGAARAAVLACDRLGTTQICILNRTRSRADTLACTLQESVTARLASSDLEEWQTLAPETGLLVNATSAGLNGTPPLDLSLEGLPEDSAVCDLVYTPLETPLLARARARGLTAIDGLGMLMHQGAFAFELLFGMRPKLSLALRTHLEQTFRDGA